LIHFYYSVLQVSDLFCVLKSIIYSI